MQMGNSRYLYKTIKTITGKFQPKWHCIQAENGEYITKPEDNAERWKEYCDELYNGAETEEHGGGHERETPPLRSEIRRAIRQLSNGKAAGPDGVPAELFKHREKATVDRLHDICAVLWEEGEWPDDWDKDPDGNIYG